MMNDNAHCINIGMEEVERKLKTATDVVRRREQRMFAQNASDCATLRRCRGNLGSKFPRLLFFEPIGGLSTSNSPETTVFDVENVIWYLDDKAYVVNSFAGPNPYFLSKLLD